MPTKLPSKVLKKLRRLRASERICMYDHCTKQSTTKWEGAYVCSRHYHQCQENTRARAKISWALFIAKFALEIAEKLTYTKDERCIMNPESCLGVPNFGGIASVIADRFMDRYIPGWARDVITKSLVKKALLAGLSK